MGIVWIARQRHRCGQCPASGQSRHRFAFLGATENRAFGSALWQTARMLTPILALVVIALVSLLAVRVGATALMLVALAHQSLRSPRRVVTPLPEEPDAERGEATL